MIKVTYTSGIDLVEMWINPEEITYLKRYLRIGKIYSHMIKIGKDEIITIDEEQFNSILTYFNAKSREERINQILDDE
jgi:hypothetical protein